MKKKKSSECDDILRKTSANKIKTKKQSQQRLVAPDFSSSTDSLNIHIHKDQIPLRRNQKLGE